MARHYTPEEANAQLAVVGPILKHAVRLKHEHDALTQRAHQDRDEEDVKSQMEMVRQQIMERLDFLRALSIQVKDLEVGLIDFPTVRDGEEVFLCWHVGEPRVAYWHSEEDGFPGRQPV